MMHGYNELVEAENALKRRAAQRLTCWLCYPAERALVVVNGYRLCPHCDGEVTDAPR
jgi:hypothetical protein